MNIKTFTIILLILVYPVGNALRGNTNITNTQQEQKDYSEQPISPSPGVSTYFCKSVALYTLGGTSLEEMAAKAIFEGFQELKVFELAQEKYFFALPRPVGITNIYLPGYLKITYNHNRTHTMYEEPNTKAIVDIRFLVDAEGNRIVRQKKLWIWNKHIETVTYEYKNGKPYLAYSTIYGYRFFQKPVTILEKLRNMWYNLLNAVLY
jgi:hypothetical protein